MEAQKKLDNEDKNLKNEVLQTEGVKQTKDTDKNGDEPVNASSAEIEEKDS